VEARAATRPSGGRERSGAPSVTRAYAKALAERRRGQIPDDQVEQAKASLDGSDDDPQMAKWVRRFLSARRRAAA
jgi:hypothetical protein